jgi:hypothetical protein
MAQSGQGPASQPEGPRGGRRRRTFRRQLDPPDPAAAPSDWETLRAFSIQSPPNASLY